MSTRGSVMSGSFASNGNNVPGGCLDAQPPRLVSFVRRIGVSFIGGRWSEPELIGLAYDFEQATHVRVPPHFLATTSAAAAKHRAKSPVAATDPRRHLPTR